MDCVVALRREPRGQGGRQLCIDDDAHYALRRTGWSLCFDANPQAADSWTSTANGGIDCDSVRFRHKARPRSITHVNGVVTQQPHYPAASGRVRSRTASAA